MCTKLNNVYKSTNIEKWKHQLEEFYMGKL